MQLVKYSAKYTGTQFFLIVFFWYRQYYDYLKKKCSYEQNVTEEYEKKNTLSHCMYVVSCLSCQLSATIH